MMTHLLERFSVGLFEVTLFEATSRLGGKVLTQRFDTIPAIYEAGVAELYDYSEIGLDPLKTLVQYLGLKAVPMDGHAVVLGDEILRNEHDFHRRFGLPAFRALNEFHKTCAALYSRSDYYEGHVAVDRHHPWAHRTFREVLDKIPDENARRYIEAAVRSDTATEPHLTSALNGLKNVLMDDSRYIRLYSIEGGIEKVVEGMAGGLKQTKIVRESRLVAIGRAPNGRYRLRLRNHDRTVACDFDRVVLALPHNRLSQIKFEDLPLRLATQKHLARYNHPAHYLRVTVLFERSFWRGKVGGSYFLSDAFGGCCVYDEGLPRLRTLRCARLASRRQQRRRAVQFGRSRTHRVQWRCDNCKFVPGHDYPLCCCSAATNARRAAAAPTQSPWSWSSLGFMAST